MVFICLTKFRTGRIFQLGFSRCSFWTGKDVLRSKSYNMFTTYIIFSQKFKMPWKGHLKLSICHFEQMVCQQQVKHWWKYRTRWHTVVFTYILRWILAKAVRSVWERKCTASCGGELRTGDWPRYRGKLWGRSFLESLLESNLPATAQWMCCTLKRTDDAGLVMVHFQLQSTTLVTNRKKIEHYCLKMWKQSTLFKWKL